MDEPEDILRRHFGYPGFRPGQRELVVAVLGGRDALGILPTGGGKSVCYQVPALMLPTLTIVVSPLVSLMVDQLGRARAAGLRAEALHAGLDPNERARVVRELREGELRLLLVAPERFQSRPFRALLPSLRASLLAVDEAHCISMWGHDFRPSYRRLREAREILGVPVLALTATATPRVRADIEGSLGMRAAIRVVGSFDRPNLAWAVRELQGGGGSSAPDPRTGAATPLLRRSPGARLVYASTRARVERIRNGLARLGLRAEAYHAGLPPGERDRVQHYFLADPRPVVVATNAFGMGIDRPDVRVVIHDQLPGSLEDYYQEAGRAGRDGRSALCLAFFHRSDARVHHTFLDATHPPLRSISSVVRLGAAGGLRMRLERRRTGRSRIRAVAGYALTRGCRRDALLRWFGERPPEGGCGACDRCRGWSGVLESLSGP
jgi:ATP-dependent DNA helicase RecQ